MDAPSEPSDFASLFKATVDDYETQTVIKLAEHPLVKELEKCDSVVSITRVLQDQLEILRGIDEKVINSLNRVVHILHALSNCTFLCDSMGWVVVQTPFSPGKTVIAGICILLAEVKDATTSYAGLFDLFESFAICLTPLDIYTKYPPTRAVTKAVQEIILELLRTLALATNQVKQGQLKKFREKLLQDIDIEAVVKRLDRLSEDEARTTAAQTLDIIYGLVKNIRVVMDGAKVFPDGVRDSLVMMQQIVCDANKSKRDQLQTDVQSWLSVPDPWKNHNIACKAHHRGTATWFIEGKALEEWKSSGSFMWIYGKPGSGKTVLCSTMIEDIDCLCKSGLASLAFFYCDFRDNQKQDSRGLISSLLLQLCAQSDPYSNILSNFYSSHGRGSHHASDDQLKSCLKEILKLPEQPPIYIIVDGVDECPKSFGMPSPRKTVLTLMEELVGLGLPSLRICVTSRPEVDIEAVLRPLAFHSVSLHEERGQTQDIFDYVTFVVNSDPEMRKWRIEDKERVIEVLSLKADGMFRWASCQLDALRHCFPGGICHALDELPKTLDETYERTLRDIDEQNWEYAHRMFQCIAVASRPLRVEELAEFLAFDFDAGQIPTFLEDWRPEDPRDAVLSTCSSLIAIVKAEDSWVIQFAHFSVKEFLTSRLATKGDPISRRYHVLLTPAHTIVARACLGILLHLDDKTNSNSLKDFPLAEYAARHWVDHALFENVSSKTQDGMKLLFTPTMPHFAIWIWIYDLDSRWLRIQRSNAPSQLNGTPLHYAVLYGLCDMVEFLVMEHSQDVNGTSGSRNQTPLCVASDKGHLEVTRVLLEHHADPNARERSSKTPLHAASRRGHVEVARVLLAGGADANIRDGSSWTPLHLASQQGHAEVARVLLENGADANARAGTSTALHLALQARHVEVARVLLEHGADVNSPDYDNQTPLHRASQEGHLEVVRLLLENGTDVNIGNDYSQTPLHHASQFGHVEVVRILLEHGADANVRDRVNWTPLLRASQNGHPEVVHVLIENGADANARAGMLTPLDLALGARHIEVLRVLLEHGANANSGDNNDLNNDFTLLCQVSQGGHLETPQALRIPLQRKEDPSPRDVGQTPLHCASQAGRLEAVRALLEGDAEPNARDDMGQTPLHLASQRGHLEVVRLLLFLERWADPNARDNMGQTPLYRASHAGHLEVVRALLYAGAKLNARDDMGQTPLYLASQEGHLEVVRVLLRRRADPNAWDDMGQNSLHRASQAGHPKVVRVLMDHGADPNALNNMKRTPLHRASKAGHDEVVHVLLERGAEPNAQDDVGQTALHLASQEGHLKVVRALLEHRANPNSPDDTRQTPLYRASQAGRLEVVRVLLEGGADPDARDDSGQTPLHLASQDGHLGIVGVLLRHKADSSARDNMRRTPLYRASHAGHLKIVHVLLERGADQSARDDMRQTPLHLASQEGHLEVVRVLLERKQDPNARDDMGQTPLYRASQAGHLEVVRVLLERGAEPNARDDMGQTPLHLASQEGHLEVVRFLLLRERWTDPNARDDMGQTPLYRALQEGHLAVIRILLEHGADTKYPNK